jgi:phage terminase Nu1 subunit (DNA packaging protein)
MGVKKHTTISSKQRAARQKNAAKATAGRLRAAAERRAAAAGKIAEAGIPPIEVSEARREAARAVVAELEARRRNSELVSLAEIRAEVTQRYALVRTRLLAVPARVRQRAPHLAAADVRLFEDLIREALEELADREAERETAS